MKRGQELIDETMSAFEDFRATNGRSPSVRELQVALGLGSVQTAHHRLLRAAAHGYLDHRVNRCPAFLLKDEVEVHEAAVKINRIQHLCQVFPKSKRSGELAQAVMEIISEE